MGTKKLMERIKERIGKNFYRLGPTSNPNSLMAKFLKIPQLGKKEWN